VTPPISPVRLRSSEFNSTTGLIVPNIAGFDEKINRFFLLPTMTVKRTSPIFDDFTIKQAGIDSNRTVTRIVLLTRDQSDCEDSGDRW
jgi:hypothetical protein